MLGGFLFCCFLLGWFFRGNKVPCLLILCASTAAGFGQIKGAQLLLTTAPAVQSVGVFSPMIKAMPAAPQFQDKGAISFYWKPGISNWPQKFRVFYGIGSATNVVVTDRTNITLRGLGEGITYQLAVSAFVDGVPMSDAPLVATNAVTYFWGDGALTHFTYSTTGRSGATNVVESTGDMQAWTEAARFLGTGARTNFGFAQKPGQQFFRTRALP